MTSSFFFFRAVVRMFKSSTIILLVAWLIPTGAICSVCRPLSIRACYRSRAMGLLLDLVKPPFGEIDQDASMERICTTRFPSQSHCISIVNDCQLEQQRNFTYLEDAYKIFHRVVCTQASFEGLRSLWDCLDRPRRKKCDRSMNLLSSPVIDDDIQQCEIARNYRQCLDDVTRDIPSECEKGKRALKEIAAAATDIMCRNLMDSQPGLSKSPSSATEKNTTRAPLKTTPESSSRRSANAQGSISAAVQESTSDALAGTMNYIETTTGYRPTSALPPWSYATPSLTWTAAVHSAVTLSPPTYEGVPANSSLNLEGTRTGVTVGDNSTKKEESQEPSAASKFSIEAPVFVLYSACLLYMLPDI
ncbi:uncharacterized protein LOC144107964 isoform X3 [Amblyomma americanum]